jgi:hypothetical protein
VDGPTFLLRASCDEVRIHRLQWLADQRIDRARGLFERADLTIGQVATPGPAGGGDDDVDVPTGCGGAADRDRSRRDEEVGLPSA